MTKFPDLPKVLYNIIDEYYTEKGRPLTYLQSEPIPKLPRDVLRIISEYAPPIIKEDLYVLYSLDPSGKVLEKIFKTTDKDIIDYILETISMPESTEDEMFLKFHRALLLDYYPVTYYLYQKLKNTGELQRGTLNSIFRMAVKERDYQTALEITKEDKSLAVDPYNPYDALTGYFEDDNHEAVEFVINNYYKAYESEGRRRGIKFNDFLLNESIKKRWFDLASKVIKLQRSRDWTRYLHVLLRYPELDKTLIEDVLKRHIENIDDIKYILNEIRDLSPNPEKHYRMLFDLGVSNDFIEEWRDPEGPGGTGRKR